MTLFAPLLFVLLTSAPEDPVRTTLDRAKTEYETEIARLRKGLLESIQNREDAARAKGDKKSVDAVKAEREEFESTGVLPKSPFATEHEKKLRSARQVLILAHTDAIREYTKKREDEKATLVEDELHLLSSVKVIPDGKQGDIRTAWGSKSGDLRFDLVEGKKWTYRKIALKETVKCVEVARTPDYIELRREDGMLFRIHGTVFYWGGEIDNKVARVWKQTLIDSQGGWSK